MTVDQLVDGMRFFEERMMRIAESTGSLGVFAAARAMRDALRGQRAGVLFSGGNVDLARFSALLSGKRIC